MNVIKFIKDLSDNYENLDNYLDQIPKSKYLYSRNIIDYLNVLNVEKNEELLESALLVASRDGVDNNYTSILCDLLSSQWHDSHEDIVLLLEESKDPASIGCLYQAAINIPDYDDGRGLAKKCIWALLAIGTEEAYSRIHDLKKINDAIISEFIISQGY